MLNRRSAIARLAFGFGSLFANGKGTAHAGVQTPSEKDAGTAQARPSADWRIPGRVGGYIRSGTIEIVHQQFDLVVVGGGLSGTCAAISAARNGVKVALVHERSMLGGNSSSEVGNFLEDSCYFNTWCRESGIIDELYTEERARNWTPSIEGGQVNSQWDLILYEWAQREKDLTLFLNTTLREVEMADEHRILAIHAAQLGTEKDFIIQAPLFIDCTGNGVLIYRSGAAFRWGKEARSEYGEPSAPEQAATDIMGSTLLFRARDAGRPVPFKRPDWAAEFATEADLTARHHSFFEHGYAWIEVGYPMHWIRDQEVIRDVLLRQLLGVWDHIKNGCTVGDVRERARNYALDFISFCPYKRESRRLLGDYVLREQDLRDPAVRPDDIAYGVWGIDVHPAGGILKRKTAPWADQATKSDFEEWATVPYGIPLRSCYSKDVENLLAAGRTLGASHVAFSSSRVLATGAITGQAVGATVALCKKYRCGPRDVAKSHAEELQQLLLRQDCSIPGVENRDPLDIARTAQVIASSESALHFAEGLEFHSARLPLAQIFPVSSDRLEKIELLLKSNASQAIRVRLGLRKAKHVWDFRSDEDLATATAEVPPGHEGYVPFIFNRRIEPGHLYYVHIGRHPELAWSLASDAELWPADFWPNGSRQCDVKIDEVPPSLVPVGVTPAYRPGPTKWCPITGGKALTMRLTPQQSPYAATNIIHGTNRPDRWTNIWISDPKQPLPAWIELKLPEPVEFNLVQITFDDNINVRAYLPQFKFPECIKRYEVAVRAAGQWKIVAAAKDNYYRRVVHNFSRVRADRLRISINETNGAKTANIYEVRIYNEPDSLQSTRSSAHVIYNKILDKFRPLPSQTL